MTIVGIDGCKGGWCAVTISNDLLEAKVFSSFSEIIKKNAKADVILVDIPIGLGSGLIPRNVDYAARKKLGPKRQSCIFIPPVRDAINAADYSSAKAINFAITRKKISIQSWNISDKIREADHFMLHNQQSRSIIHEAHPELCFKYLASGKDLESSKNSPGRKGIEERIEILRSYDDRAAVFLEQYRQKYPRKVLKEDDLVDAFCLAITGKLGLFHGFQQISGDHTHDEQGIEMSLYYYDPTRNEHKSKKL